MMGMPENGGMPKMSGMPLMVPANIPRIRGELVNLTPIRVDPEAVSLYLRWMNDEELLWQLNSNNSVLSAVKVAPWFSGNATNDTQFFGIVDASTDELIGICLVRSKFGSHSGNIVIAICNKEKQNRGLGTEALKLLIRYAVDDLKYHRLDARCVARNERAIHFFKKNGFDICGVDHEDSWMQGRWWDMIRFELLTKEFYHQVADDDGHSASENRSSYDKKIWE